MLIRYSSLTMLIIIFKGLLILFLEGNRLIYNNMKQKQKTLKKLLKDKTSIQKLLNMLGSDTVAEHFLNQRDHEQGLQQIDPQLLDIVLTNLLSINDQQEQSSQSIIKIDVLTLSEAQLLAFCRQKDLINFYEYINTIRNKQYKQHSDYGYMLVGAFPNQFMIGERCTHYHCRTTAHKIQSQYGIYHNRNNDEADNSGEIEQADYDFINDDDQEQSSEQIVVKRKKKSKKKQNVNEQNIQELNNSNKKKSMKNMLDSDDEQQNRRPNKSSNSKKRNKMDVVNEDDEISPEDSFLYQVLEKLDVQEILEVLQYSSLFQSLSEKHIEKLIPIKDQITQAVLFNKKKAKRQKNSASKTKGHTKRLTKSKINLKEIDFVELLRECTEHGLVPAGDIEQWQNKYGLEDHPKLAHKLLQKNPTAYVIDGLFSGFIEEDINVFIENAYQQYEIRQNQQRQENLEGLQNDEEDDQSVQEEDDDEADQSDYSIDSQEEGLGQL